MPSETTARRRSDRGASDLEHAFRAAPPLVATRDEIDRLVTMADEALTIAEGEFAGEFAA